MKKAHRFGRVLGLMVVAYAAVSFLGLLGHFFSVGSVGPAVWLRCSVVLAGPLGVPTAADQAAAPALDPGLYHHVARVVWVVGDLDRVVGYWQKLGVHDLRDDGVVTFPSLTYHGKPDPASARRIIGHIGVLEIEWLQPVKGGEFWSSGLREHVTAFAPSAITLQLRRSSTVRSATLPPREWEW